MCASFPLFLFVSCRLQMEHRGSRALLPRPPWKVNKGPILTEGSVTWDCKMTLTVLTVTLQSKQFIDILDCDSSLPQKAQKPGVTVQTVKQVTSLQPNLFVWRKENKRHLSMITSMIKRWSCRCSWCCTNPWQNSWAPRRPVQRFI